MREYHSLHNMLSRNRKDHKELQQKNKLLEKQTDDALDKVDEVVSELERLKTDSVRNRQ